MGELQGAARCRIKQELPVGTADKVAGALLMSPSWTALRESQTHHLTSHGGLTTHTDADRVEPDAVRAACPVRRRLIGLNPELGRSPCDIRRSCPAQTNPDVLSDADLPLSRGDSPPWDGGRQGQTLKEAVLVQEGENPSRGVRTTAGWQNG
jgi:hypothetical protein